jgi:hypothetical protein
MDASVISKETLKGNDFYLCLGDFLDEFYRTGHGARKAMLEIQPDFSIPHENLAFLASAVHKLANDHGLRVPDWVFDERCYLRDKPFFGCRARGNLRLLFMYKSPIEFKHRNLFVDENVLVRV